MNRSALGTSLALAALIAWSFPGSHLLAARQEPTVVPALALSSDLQAPGNVAVISVSLTVPEGVGIGKAVSEISFPTKLVALEEAIRGLSTEAVGGEVKTVPQASVGEDSVVQIVVTAKEGERLPAGALAELRFRVLAGAPVGTTVTLKNKGSAWSDKKPPTPIESLKSSDGEITVSATAPLPACFFYMH